MFKNKTIITLFLITLLGGILRFFMLDKFPVSPNWDEVSHGYNAFSILTTGKDEWGIKLPLIFRAFGDFKLPLYIYLTSISVAVFGLNTFAIRFVSALAGTLAIPGIFLLTGVLFPEKKLQFKKLSFSLPIISSIFLAVLPWHFFISHPALEANLALTLIIFGGYFLIKGIETPKNFLPAAILFGLSLHTYNTARVFIPLLLISFVLLYYKKLIITRWAVISFLIIIFFGGIVAFQMATGAGTARYGKLNIITESTAYTLGQKRTESNLPPLVAKLVYNRPLFFIQTAIANYFNYFSPGFFNQSLGAQTQFAIPGKNLIGLPLMLLFLIGFVYLVRHPKDKSNQFIFIWFALSPVAAALTVDPPQALRPNPMIPAIVIISGLGLLYLLEKISTSTKIIITSVFVITILLNFCLYLNDFFVTYPKTYSEAWQYGYQELYQYLSTQNDYDKFFITKRYGEPHIFYAFYNKLNPEILQDKNITTRFFQTGWYWTDKIDNYYFVNEFDTPNTEIKTLTLEHGEIIDTKNSLLVTTVNHIPKNSEVIKVINFLDGYPAFTIVKMK